MTSALKQFNQWNNLTNRQVKIDAMKHGDYERFESLPLAKSFYASISNMRKRNKRHIFATMRKVGGYYMVWLLRYKEKP